MKWPFGRKTLKRVARIGALSAMAVSSGGFVGCSDSDDAPPLAVGAQWFDANEGETTVTTLDFPTPQDVVNTAGGAEEYGATVSLSTAVVGIQVLFNEPLNADVIENLEINTDDPVNVDEEQGEVILNRKSKYNPGVVAITGRRDLVELVDITNGKVYSAVAEYLNNIRANESVVTRDVGLSITPDDLLPSNTEFQLRIYAGEIEDRDGNILRAADRTAIPEDGGQEETIGQVTAPDGRPIAAIAVFLTDPISVTAITEPHLPTDDEGATVGTVVVDDSATYEDETAILVEFNTDVSLDSTLDAFTLTDAAGNVIPVTVIKAQSGPTTDEGEDPDDPADDVALEAEVNDGAVQVVPDAPLAAGDYELRVDPTYADFEDSAAVDIQIFEFTVE